MKYIILLAVLVTSSAFAKPADYDSVKRAKLIEWVEQMRTITHEAQENAKKSEADLGTAVQQILKLEAEVVAQRDWGIERDTAAWKAEQERDHEKKARLAIEKRFNGLKTPVSAVLAFLAALIVALLIMRFASPALNTLGGIGMAFGIPLAVGVAIFTFLKIII